MAAVSTKLLTIALLAHLNATAQFAGQGRVLDSLQKNIENYPEPDTFRLNALSAVLEQSMRNAAPSKAEKFYIETMQLAQKYKHRDRIASAYRFMGFNLVAKKDYHSGLSYLDSAVEAYKKVEQPYKRSWGIAISNMDKARAFSYMGDKETQLRHLLLALQIFDSIQHQNSVYVAMSISGVYRELYNNEKALHYAAHAVRASDYQQNADLKSLAYLNYALSWLSVNQSTKTEEWLAKARPLINSKNVHQLWTYYNYLGLSRHAQGRYEEAREDFKQALQQAQMAGHESFILNILSSLVRSSLQTRYWRDTRQYLDQYLELARKVGKPIEEREALRSMSEFYAKSGEFKKANEYSRMALKVNDSLMLEKNAEQLTRLEARYQFEKKENEINRLQQETRIQGLSLRQQSIYNYILAGIAIGLIIISLLLYRNYRHRQKLHTQKIRELEKDRQLSVADSILIGQESERERLAKDLHDGLGGLLSGVKLSLVNVKSNMIISGDQAEAFEKSLVLLDTSITELRRVAHNMMPEVLIKSGLDTALTDYCKAVNASGNIKVTYQGYGRNMQLGNTEALFVYRIVQELINNVLRHAEATEILVQVIQRKDVLHLTVEDNGKGFDIQTLGEVAGAGWKNIKSRVEYLKGVIDLKSEPGKGTSVNIEITL